MNKYESILMDVGRYYVLYNDNQPYTHVKKCSVIEMDDKVYVNKYVYDIKLGYWKFSWYAIWVMITHCRECVRK